ncbi:MAG: tetratricopeptide repeat protein [Pyrinomonadaceae bacterium]|jgi:tetratricopeptide (TPR) repeat protein|nr:tetratricopeptide repeat protein [Pyrinomonadaceae bacterium]
MRNYRKIVNHKVLGKVFICFLFISTFCVQSFAQQEEWYLGYAAGDKPKRAAFFVDMNSVSSPAANVRSINLVSVFEEKGSPQYTSVKMEFRCNANESRIASGFNYTFENTSVAFKDSPWQKISNPLFETLKNFACDVETFNKARFFANEGGKINNDKLNAQLKSYGLSNTPILLMTSSLAPDFDTILEILWSKFWQTTRPSRSGVAQKTVPSQTNKNYQPTQKDLQTAEALVKSGAESMRSGNYDRALANFTKALELVPNYSAPYFYRGYIFTEVGEYDIAIANYTKAIEFNQNDWASYLNRGLLYFEQKHKFTLAESDFNKAVQLDPQNANLYFVRADLYESWGKTDLEKADRKKFESLGGYALPGFQNRKRTLFPNAEFDTDLAKRALEQGSSTLIGRACAYYDGYKFDAANAKVVLYPVTPYFEKWYDLREKREDDKTSVFINKEATKYALITQANSEGRFVFSRLKPGKYFVQIIFSFNQRKTYSVYTGSDSTTDYYAIRNYNVGRSDRLEKFIEIKDGDTEKITLKNKRTIKGCSDKW